MHTKSHRRPSRATNFTRITALRDARCVHCVAEIHAGDEAFYRSGEIRCSDCQSAFGVKLAVRRAGRRPRRSYTPERAVEIKEWAMTQRIEAQLDAAWKRCLGDEAA